MNTSLIKGGIVMMSAVLTAFAAQTARADEVTTTITTDSGRCMTTTLGPGPGLLITNSAGQQLQVPSRMSANPVLFVTTGEQITGFVSYTPDDLITRRDDLLARIIVERANGKLSAEQANSLISEVQGADSARLQLCKGDESCVDHVKAVKKIYRSFDEVSNDIVKDSNQGNRQLAGKYNYIVL